MKIFCFILALGFANTSFAGEAFELMVQSFSPEDINRDTGRKVTLADIYPESEIKNVKLPASEVNFSDRFGSSYGHTLELTIRKDIGMDIIFDDYDYLHFDSLTDATKFKNVVETQKVNLLFDYSRDYESSWSPLVGKYSEGFNADDGVYVFIPSKNKWVPLMVSQGFSAQRFSKSFTSEYLNN